MALEREVPPLPNGWFAVAWADDLKPGEVKPLRCLERDLVIFRARNGSVGVLDAYCPHLGAHLGFGRVEGDRIICPFHHWEFDVAGVCQKIPHTKTIPKKAALAVWPVRETNRVIQIYHHAAQHPAINEPATFAPLEANGWTVCGRDQYRLRSHPYDLAENGADEVHLRTVHGSTVVSSRLVENESEFATYFELAPMLGRHRLPLRVALETHIRELGHMIITVHIGQRISFHIVEYMTPVERDLVEVRHLYLVKSGHGVLGTTAYLAGRVVLRFALANSDRDKPIWNHKSFRRSPVLSEGDGMLGRFRRWARRFYQVDGEATGGSEREISERNSGTARGDAVVLSAQQPAPHWGES